MLFSLFIAFFLPNIFAKKYVVYYREMARKMTNNYFLNRVKSSTFLSLIFVGGSRVAKKCCQPRGQEGWAGWDWKAGKGGARVVGNTFCNKWPPTIMRERIVLLFTS